MRNRGGLDIDYRAPVEIHEERREDTTTAVRNPIVQAAAVGSSLVGVVVSVGLNVLAYGPGVVWVSTAIISLTSYIWCMRALYTGDEDARSLINRAIGSVAFSTLIGLALYSVWRIFTFMGLTVHSPWLVMSMRIGAPLALVFWTAVSGLLFLRFGQELFFGSPLMEQAIANIVEELVIHWGKLRKPKPQMTLVYANRGQRPIRGEEGDIEELAEVLDEDEALDGRYDLLEWLVLGQRLLGDDGRPLLYRRRQWDGMQLSSGTIVTERRAKMWSRKLSQAGLLVMAGGQLNIPEEMVLSEVLEHISVDNGISLPRPEIIGGWLERYSPDPSRPVPPRPALQPTDAVRVG